MRIKAKQWTVLTTENLDSSKLLDSQKFSVQENSEYEVKILETKGNKTKVVIELYAYLPHWEVEEKSNQSLKPANSNSEAVQRQINRLSRYLIDGKSLNLDVPSVYASQRDNQRDPHRTCNSSSNAMYLDWLLRVTGREGLGKLPNGNLDDNKYVAKVFSFGDTIYHENQTKAIESYGFNTKWNIDKDLTFVYDLLKAGFPVVCNILHRGTTEAPKGGHLIMLIAHKQDYLINHDPYGTLQSDYSNTKGAFSAISHEEFKSRWQGGYRILA